jgi:proline dehydrogenase
MPSLNAVDMQPAADVLRRLALSEPAKHFVLTTPLLYSALLRAAQRYIAGEDLATARGYARAANAAGHAVTFDYMGESTRDAATARAATAEFIAAAGAIKRDGLNATLSLDLSHIGLVIDATLCFDNAMAIATAMQGDRAEIIISAEGEDRTDAVLGMYERLSAARAPYGITLQAFLHRTPADLERVLALPGKVRIVKGAFDVPAALSHPRGSGLDDAYVELIQRLAEQRHPFSAATHDDALLPRLRPLLTRDVGEFERLKGIGEDGLHALRREGFRTRQYLPYGTEWFLYLCNRLAEYPPDLFAAIAAAGG